MSKTLAEEQIPSPIRADTKNVTETEKESLEGIENAFERMTRNTQLAPYFLTTPSDKPYRTPQAQQNNWCLGTPFGQDEEHLQYATFLYRESQDTLFVLKTQHDEDARQREKLLGMEGSKSHTSTPLHNQTAKKKISLSAYKQARLNGQIPASDSQDRPGSRDGAQTRQIVEQTGIQKNHSNTENSSSKEIAKMDESKSKISHKDLSTHSHTKTKLKEDSDSGGSVKLLTENHSQTFESPRKRLRISPNRTPKQELSQKRTSPNNSRAHTLIDHTGASSTTPKALPVVQVERPSPPPSIRKPKGSRPTAPQTTSSPLPQVSDTGIFENGAIAPPQTLPSWLPDLSDSHKSEAMPMSSSKRLTNVLPPWAPNISTIKSRHSLPPFLDDAGWLAYASPSAASHASSSQSETHKHYSASSPVPQSEKVSVPYSKLGLSKNSVEVPKTYQHKDAQLRAKSEQGGIPNSSVNSLPPKQKQDSTIDKKEQAPKTISSTPNVRTVKVTSAPNNIMENFKVSTKSTNLPQSSSTLSKAKDDQKIVKLSYGKGLIKEVEAIIGQKRKLKSSQRPRSNDQTSQSSGLDVNRSSHKRPLEEINPDTEETPSKKHKTGDTSVANSPKTPLLASTKSPAYATPSITLSKQAISTKSDASTNSWSSHSEKMQKLGKNLKRTMQSFLKESKDSTAATNMGRAKRAAIQGIESILCYIQAFNCLDQTRHHSSDPSANWKSLDPLASDVCYACQSFPHLHGFSLLLRSVCCQMVVNGYTRVKPENLPQTATSLTELLKFTERASRLSVEANTHLSKHILSQYYPSTYTISQILPLGMAARPMTIVRMGCAFLQEWTKRENLNWTQSLEEGKCSELP